MENNGIYVYEFVLDPPPYRPHGTVNTASLSAPGVDTFLTYGNEGRTYHLRSLYEGMTLTQFMRDYQMRIMYRQMSRHCKERFLLHQKIKNTHRKQWGEVMDQIEEVGLRPSDPESAVPLLQKGGAVYLELIA